MAITPAEASKRYRERQRMKHFHPRVAINLLFPKTLTKGEAFRKRRTIQRRVARQMPIEKQRFADASMRWYYRHPETVRERRVTYLYGLSPEEHRKLIAAQEGLCAICRNPETQKHHRHGTPKPLNVDHIRGTKTVRGLLCNACNTAIGLFREDPTLFEAAVRYLRKVN